MMELREELAKALETAMVGVHAHSQNFKDGYAQEAFDGLCEDFRNVCIAALALSRTIRGE